MYFFIIFVELNLLIMANGLNRVTLIGHLGKTPEVRSYESGKNVRFTLATNEDYKSKNGEKITHTEWHNISMWRGLADIAERFLKKGDRIYIEGRLRNRSYEQDGIKKYFTEIEADNMIMLEKQTDDANQAVNQSTTPAIEEAEVSSEQIFTPNINNDDGLPF